MLSVEKKWEKISKEGKYKYVYLSVPIFRIIPVILLLSIIYNFIYEKDAFGIFGIGLSVLVKGSVGYCLGVVIAKLEWNFYNALISREYSEIRNIRNQYMLIYGILTAGCTILISMITFPYTSGFEVIKLFTWPVFGVIFSFGMWLSFSSEAKGFLG